MAVYTTVGKPTARIEGPEKATGAALYAADIKLPGMLWGKALRSPLPHARVLHIDTSKAKALPGVKAVLAGDDLPPRSLAGRMIRDVPILAQGKVRFIGDKVAAVAATDPDIAEEALALIDVEYEELPAVYDPLEAMKEGAPIIHEDLKTYPGLPKEYVDLPNVISLTSWAKGDVEGGFAESDHIFENTFTTPRLHQGYIEPHACVVSVEPTGHAQVWASMKAPYLLRKQLAGALNLPEAIIKINPCYIGGDFGGKGSPMDIPLCYYLSKSTGHPVKMVMSYIEELMAGNPRHPSIITIKTGVKKDGRLWAWNFHAVFDSGAYGGFKGSPSVNLHGADKGGGVYRIPHTKLKSYSVYTNNIPCGHMRGPGQPQTVFAVESQIDIIAHELGMDPYEFRLLNAVEEGDANAIGEKWHFVRCKETIQKTVEASGWGKPKPSPYYGIGFALTERPPALGQSHAIISLDDEGIVRVQTAVPDQGTGTHTVMRQVVAEELKIPLDSVRISVVDTDLITFDSGVGGSRTTVVHGGAALHAAQELKRTLISLASELLGWPTESVAYLEGRLELLGDGRERISFQKLAAKACRAKGGPVSLTVSHAVREEHLVTSFCAQMAEVEVDPETGQVTVKKIISGHDVGTIINPLMHQGQIEGGVIQGMGFALLEELLLEDGRVTTLSLGDFKIPNIKDIPELVTVLLESPSGPGPMGAKGIGELSNAAVAPAIANAVYDAIGIRIKDLPVTAEKVLRALKSLQNPPRS